MANSMYLASKPAFFGNNAWPWVDPTTGATHTLPARRTTTPVHRSHNLEPLISPARPLTDKLTMLRRAPTHLCIRGREYSLTNGARNGPLLRHRI